MKVKCENIVRCGNYSCCHNTDGYFCNRKVVALDSFGKCSFIRPKETRIPNPLPNPAGEKSNAC